MTTRYAPPHSSPPGGGAPAPRAPPSIRNVAVVSHAPYVLTVTNAWVNALPHALRPRWVKRLGDLDLLTLKVVSESCVTWATSVPILVFLGLSVFNLGPMYASDVRQTDVRQKHRLMPPPIRGGGMIKSFNYRLQKHCHSNYDTVIDM